MAGVVGHRGDVVAGRRTLVLGVAAGVIAGAGIGLAAGLLFSMNTPSGAPQLGVPSAAGPTPPPSPTTQAEPTFPTRDTTGVPAGWTPKQEWTGDQTIADAGAVVEDVRLTDGTLYVRAPNVTLRRVEIVGGRIVNDYGTECSNGLRIEDSSILRGDNDPENPVIEAGGYTLRRVKIDGPSEGIRVGEKGLGCGPVDVEDSWVQVDPPDNCVADNVDWHGDGLQGYQGSALTIRNSYLRLAEVKGCSGTAAFFYPDQGNTSVTVDHVLVSGGGYVFRLGTPGSVTGLKVVDDSWDFGPVDVANCGVVSWGAGNEIVEVNTDGSLTSVGSLGCVTR